MHWPHAPLFRPEDDPSFVAWLRRHPDGFVVNVDADFRHPIVHRATCASLDHAEARSAGGQRKVCSPDLFDLASWARLKHDHALRLCGRCRPDET